MQDPESASASHGAPSTCFQALCEAPTVGAACQSQHAAAHQQPHEDALSLSLSLSLSISLLSLLLSLSLSLSPPCGKVCLWGRALQVGPASGECVEATWGAVQTALGGDLGFSEERARGELLLSPVKSERGRGSRSGSEQQRGEDNKAGCRHVLAAVWKRARRGEAVNPNPKP